MSPDPAGRWEVRARPLGTRTDGCQDVVRQVVVHASGSVVIGARDGEPPLTGSWHQAGEGRVVVRATGRWGTVEAAVELSADGHSLSGRALARHAVNPSGDRPAVTVVEVDGSRTTGSDASPPPS